MRFPDDDVDDFYPPDLDQPSPKPSKAAPEGTARLRLIAGGPELERQRKFYIYLLLSIVLCLALAVWVFVNQAQRQRLTSASTNLIEEMRLMDEKLAQQTAPVTLDAPMFKQRAELDARHINLVRQINQKSRIPYFFYIPLTLLLAILLFNALTLVGQIGRTVFEFFKGGVCLLSASLTVLAFNVAFVWYFFSLHMWLFSIAFVLMVLSIILIISPSMFLVFAGSRFRRNSQKIETLEELQERLPFDD